MTKSQAKVLYVSLLFNFLLVADVGFHTYREHVWMGMSKECSAASVDATAALNHSRETPEGARSLIRVLQRENIEIRRELSPSQHGDFTTSQRSTETPANRGALA